MKVGDLVKFQDVSSFVEIDPARGSFQELTGSVGVVLKLTTTTGGFPITTVLMNGKLHSFHPDYFKETINESR